MFDVFVLKIIIGVRKIERKAARFCIRINLFLPLSFAHRYEAFESNYHYLSEPYLKEINTLAR